MGTQGFEVPRFSATSVQHGNVDYLDVDVARRILGALLRHRRSTIRTTPCRGRSPALRREAAEVIRPDDGAGPGRPAVLVRMPPRSRTLRQPSQTSVRGLLSSITVRRWYRHPAGTTGGYDPPVADPARLAPTRLPSSARRAPRGPTPLQPCRSPRRSAGGLSLDQRARPGPLAFSGNSSGTSSSCSGRARAGADTVVTSVTLVDHCRLTAAAGARLGLLSTSSSASRRSQFRERR